MLSKAQIKYIHSLTQQKYRKQHDVFIAEGDKIAREWLASNASVQIIAALESWTQTNKSLIGKHPEAIVATISETVLSSISTLQTPNQVLLVVSKPVQKNELPVNEWTIALDGVQDPGNMGTIIRIADWFGIRHLVRSYECVDIYNPKVVQAAMGGHLRINFYESDLLKYINSSEIPVLAAALHGKSIYEFSPFDKAILIIGNESKGIHPALIEKSSHQINIPGAGQAESLNAAISTGILCSHLVPH